MMRAVVDTKPDDGGPPSVDFLEGTDAGERLDRGRGRYRFLEPGESPFTIENARAAWKAGAGVIVALVVALAAALWLPSRPASAAVTVMCAPESAGVGGGGPRSTNLPALSTPYVLDQRGCVLANFADVPALRAAGWVPAISYSTPIQITTGVLTGTTSVQIGTLPASAIIDQIVVQNLTANAVTGNVNFGSTSGGSDIAAFGCAANCLSFATDAQISKRAVSATAPTPLFATAATSWNSANVVISVLYSYY